MGASEGEDLVMNDAQVSHLSNWTGDGATLQENEAGVGEKA